jgi:hypothetical protein
MSFHLCVHDATLEICQLYLIAIVSQNEQKTVILVVGDAESIIYPYDNLRLELSDIGRRPKEQFIDLLELRAVIIYRARLSYGNKSNYYNVRMSCCSHY